MKVCITGSSLSSLALANALVNQNIYVDLFVNKKPYVLNKSRTIGISKSNIDYFKDNIVNIEDIIWKLKKIEIFSDNLENEKLLNFENKKNELFSIVRNSQLNKILEKNLLKNKYFKYVNLKKSLVSLKNYNIVINTDYNNQITKKFFNKKIVKKYNSFAYTTIIKHEKIMNNTATQFFTKMGPLAFLPISNNETSIVYSIHDSRKIDQKLLRELIYKYNFKYNIKSISKFETFELISLSLRSYYNGNILSFGDLLHRIHPLAGQGFNMTIRDIKILIEIIKNKIEFGLPLDSSINLEFEKKSKHKNFIFLYGIDFIHEFFNLERKQKIVC